MSRVLLLVKSLDHGGAQRLLADCVKAGAFDYEVAYLLPARNALVPELEATGTRVTCLETRRAQPWPLRLRAHARKSAIDLVHAHSPYAAVGARLALPRGMPLVYTEHNVWPAYHPATRWANRLTFARNDHVFAVSDAVRASIRSPPQRAAKPMPPIETLHHGLRHRPSAKTASLRGELGLTAETPLVCTVAEFRAEKGHQHLLQAAAEVQRSAPEVRFALIGDGPREPAMRRCAAELNLSGTAIFAGRRDDAANAVRECDVFVLPSLQEGLPLALLEAMAQARPVVVTDAGGLTEVIRNAEDGLVVPAGDPPALAQAILQLLRDDGLRERLGRAAAERAATFDLSKAVSRIEAVYEDLLR
jgi:glycosyltransferase involved in cell wall biosynthesis